jgi:hypothetical protein
LLSMGMKEISSRGLAYPLGRRRKERPLKERGLSERLLSTPIPAIPHLSYVIE